MLESRLDIELTLVGPILTQSSAPSSYGLDAPAARNSANQCFLPGTLVKGRLLQAAQELNEIASFGFDTDFWFGKVSGNRDSLQARVPFEPCRGRLTFSDFIGPAANTSRRTRIQIDPLRGAAAEQMMQILESPFASGEYVTFRGQAHVRGGSAEQIQTVVDQLEKLFGWIHSMGAGRTFSFGRVRSARVARVVAVPASTVEGWIPSRCSVVLRADVPFCVTASRPGENLFKSGPEIPGGVLKGAIATAWLHSIGKTQTAIEPKCDPQREALAVAFEKIRFSFARPVQDGVTASPSLIPLSTVSLPGSGFVDLALHESQGLVMNQVPKFQVDWKPSEFSAACAEFDLVAPKTELRVRTAIDRANRRSKTGQLFAYEMIRPEGFSWFGEIDLTEVDPLAAQQLGVLLSHGIPGIGKTKTTFSVRPGMAPPPRYPSNPQAARDNKFVVTLASPTLLLDGEHMAGTSSRADLEAELSAIWDELSGHSLSLIRYFSRQSLKGGLYLHNRFQKGNGKPYTPYLLTEPGSVFVLEVRDAIPARARIAKWARTGLDLPAWVRDRFARNGFDGHNWRNNPFVPQNGFGEIAVNMDLHWNRRPSNEHSLAD